MKKFLIILGLFLIQNVFAIEKIYIQQPSSFNYLRPTYNPYSNMYYSPYRYRKTNYNNPKRIQRINRIRNLNRIKNNVLTWNFLNRNNNGALTGYSVPINQNAYNLITPKTYFQTAPSTNLTTDLFSTPTGTKGYYRNGHWVNDDGGLSNKAGVRIIYD